ncbi:DNA polymerase III subunit delta [bacterium]|nr:DNA polymerase III subunit delta [bacterium]
MAQYFFGDDTYGARQAIGAAVLERKATIQHIYSTDVTDETLGELFDRGDSLFGVQIAVLHNPSALPKALQEKLVDLLKGASQDSMILWDQAGPDKRSKFWQQVKPTAREFTSPPAPELVAWLIDEAQERNGAIDQQAAQELVARVGTDRWRLSTQLDQLLLRGGITLSRVQAEVSAQEAAEIFPTLDALVAGDTARAVHNVELLLATGENEFYILSMLAYQFRTLLIIRTGLDEGLTAADIARRGKLHPYVVQKNTAVVQGLTRTALLTALTRIAGSDFAIKQGKADARTALMMLVLALAGR